MYSVYRLQSVFNLVQTGSNQPVPMSRDQGGLHDQLFLSNSGPPLIRIRSNPLRPAVKGKEGTTKCGTSCKGTTSTTNVVLFVVLQANKTFNFFSSAHDLAAHK